MITVSTIRDMNGLYGHADDRVLVCPNGCGEYAADLARYWSPRDDEVFCCSECDRELWLQFRPASEVLPLAQRVHHMENRTRVAGRAQ